jgi:hypothetical protein
MIVSGFHDEYIFNTKNRNRTYFDLNCVSNASTYVA